jgi:hypothetical protein
VQVIDVRAGDRFRRFGDDRFELSIERESDFEWLLREIGGRTSHPIDIVHLAGVTTEAPSPDGALSSGFYSVLALAQGIDRTALSRNVHVTVVTSGAQSVTGDEQLMPAKAAVLGPCRVIPQEMTHVGCSHVDIAGATLSDAQLAALTTEDSRASGPASSRSGARIAGSNCSSLCARQLRGLRCCARAACT